MDKGKTFIFNKKIGHKYKNLFTQKSILKIHSIPHTTTRAFATKRTLTSGKCATVLKVWQPANRNGLSTLVNKPYLPLQHV